MVATVSFELDHTPPNVAEVKVAVEPVLHKMVEPEIDAIEGNAVTVINL